MYCVVLPFCRCTVSYYRFVDVLCRITVCYTKTHVTVLLSLRKHIILLHVLHNLVILTYEIYDKLHIATHWKSLVDCVLEILCYKVLA